MRVREEHRAQVWKLEKVGGFTSITSFPPTTIRNSQTNTDNRTGKRSETHKTPILKQALIEACSGLSITPEEFAKHLSIEDVNDIESGDMTPENLRAWCEHFNEGEQ